MDSFLPPSACRIPALWLDTPAALPVALCLPCCTRCCFRREAAFGELLYLGRWPARVERCWHLVALAMGAWQLAGAVLPPLLSHGTGTAGQPRAAGLLAVTPISRQSPALHHPNAGRQAQFFLPIQEYL